ncbi:septal ring lytic transglycosylase RlpA family protein [Methyloversatilis sp.]|uniref:septal ring lytic transglycosylase RlpA family protein n=2 Tax=Methyloversatilis sp. TaxID=2569862 RepID=UPI002736ECB8|nr:septal ring lytic transglycosylase RlpA family protein [Methyloversatilis sp.]MDP3456164.1 septal ring lytic transglycosylase RlpA family protein [Methyloversatilis sp.]MDP3577417.1 septal ring lytic transglycosylase RlpA family protein [Methyloversatilis sp.]
MIAARSLWPVALCAVLAGCAGVPVSEPPAPAAPAGSAPASTAPVATPAPSGKPRPGGYYLDDGPGDNAPDALTLAAIPDAAPRDEPLHRFANRPYSALGLSFVPLSEHRPFRQRGRASWYGRKFHGQKTSSGEPYDMYGMTAAHATLPIPSYARVTHLASGRSVVVRVNDRGPFKPGRVIDLSWTAAAKLGYVNDGSAEVEVEAVFAPGSAGDLLARRAAGQPEIARPAPGPAAPAAPADDVIAALAADGADGPSTTGHWLQLGAFSTLDNAQALSRRIAEALGELADRISVSSDGDRHRVRAGPFESRDAAQGAARALRDQLGLEALLLTR